MKTINYIITSAFVMYLISGFQIQAFAQCTVAFTTCHDTIVLWDCDNTLEETINWPPVIANQTGFCTNFSLTQIAGPAPGSSVPIGTYLMRFLAEAEDINSGLISYDICDFFLKVLKDIEPPVFTFCPPNITIQGVDDGTGNCSAKGYWIQPTSIDNCSNSTVSPGTVPCGSAFSDGTHNVSYTATDGSGNVSTCTFTVTVLCITNTQEETSAHNSFRAYPNPTASSIHLRLSEPARNLEIVRVIDLHGKSFIEEIFLVGTLTKELDVEKLNPGLYFLQYISNNQILYVNRFVKM